MVLHHLGVRSAVHKVVVATVVVGVLALLGSAVINAVVPTQTPARKDEEQDQDQDGDKRYPPTRALVESARQQHRQQFLQRRSHRPRRRGHSLERTAAKNDRDDRPSTRSLAGMGGGSLYPALTHPLQIRATNHVVNEDMSSWIAPDQSFLQRKTSREQSMIHPLPQNANVINASPRLARRKRHTRKRNNRGFAIGSATNNQQQQGQPLRHRSSSISTTETDASDDDSSPHNFPRVYALQARHQAMQRYFLERKQTGKARTRCVRHEPSAVPHNDEHDRTERTEARSPTLVPTVQVTTPDDPRRHATHRGTLNNSICPTMDTRQPAFMPKYNLANTMPMLPSIRKTSPTVEVKALLVASLKKQALDSSGSEPQSSEASSLSYYHRDSIEPTARVIQFTDKMHCLFMRRTLRHHFRAWRESTKAITSAILVQHTWRGYQCRTTFTRSCLLVLQLLDQQQQQQCGHGRVEQNRMQQMLSLAPATDPVVMQCAYRQRSWAAQTISMFAYRHYDQWRWRLEQKKKQRRRQWLTRLKQRETMLRQRLAYSLATAPAGVDALVLAVEVRKWALSVMHHIHPDTVVIPTTHLQQSPNGKALSRIWSSWLMTPRHKTCNTQAMKQEAIHVTQVDGYTATTTSSYSSVASDTFLERWQAHPVSAQLLVDWMTRRIRRLRFRGACRCAKTRVNVSLTLVQVAVRCRFALQLLAVKQRYLYGLLACPELIAVGGHHRAALLIQAAWRYSCACMRWRGYIRICAVRLVVLGATARGCTRRIQQMRYQHHVAMYQRWWLARAVPKASSHKVVSSAFPITLASFH